MKAKVGRVSRSLGLLAATVALAAFALPASAAKTISLSVTPVGGPLTSQTTVVSATIGNTGNSNANSFEIDWSPSPYFTVKSATAGGVAGNCSAAGSKPGYSGCVFLKQLPTKTSVTVTLTVEVASQCTSLSIGWYAFAWTGAPGPASQSFTLDGAPPVTMSSPNCSITFVTQPKDAFIDSTITGSAFNSAGAPVTVQLNRYAAPVSGTAVTLSAVPTGCATGPSTATTDTSGNVVLANALAFTGKVAGSCQLHVSATGFDPADSQSFQIAPHGDLGCDTSNNTFGTSSVAGLLLEGTRLGNVADAAPDAVGGHDAPNCRVVPYTVSATCPSGIAGNCVNFVYDPLDQGTHMAFAFHTEWPLEAIPPTGVEGILPTLQYFINGRTVGLELDYCPEIDPIYVGGTVTGINPAKPPNDQDLTVPGTQAGCLILRTSGQIHSQLKVIEDSYIQGDYTAARR